MTKVGVSHHGRPRVGGCPFWKIKFFFTKADAGVIKGFRTKGDLAWGGSHLEKKFPLHQGSPRRDKGFRTKADLAWGGTLLEIKFLFTKAHPGVTKDLAPRQTSRGGGPF